MKYLNLTTFLLILTITAGSFAPVNCQQNTPSALNLRPKYEVTQPQTSNLPQVRPAIKQTAFNDSALGETKIIIRTQTLEQEPAKTVQNSETSENSEINPTIAPAIKALKEEALKSATEIPSQEIQPKENQQQEIKTSTVTKKPVIELRSNNGGKNSNTLNSYISHYNYSFDKTLASLLSALSKNNFTVQTYDSKNGEIICSYNGKKQFYAIVRPSITEKMMVRITPVDGNYNYPTKLVTGIFNDMKEIQ